MQVLDDGVSITLIGKDSDPLFVWAIGMVVCAFVVAVICFTMPVSYAIGSVAILAILMYFFNQKKHAIQTQKHHNQGNLILKDHYFNINGIGLSLSDDAHIVADANSLTVADKGMVYRFSEFADGREIEIAKAVLMGQKIARRNVNIKINDKV